MQLDVDPNRHGRNCPIVVGVVQEFYQQVETTLDREVRPDRDDAPLKVLRHEVRRYLDLDDGPLLEPQHLVQEMRDALPDETLFFVDIGTSMT